MAKGKFTSTQPGALTPEEVAQIRKLHREGHTQVSIALKFRRAPYTIYKIIKRLSYSQIAIVETGGPLQQVAQDELAASAQRLLGLQQLLDENAKPNEVDVTELMKELDSPQGPDRELLADEVWEPTLGRIRKRTPYD